MTSLSEARRKKILKRKSQIRRGRGTKIYASINSFKLILKEYDRELKEKLDKTLNTIKEAGEDFVALLGETSGNHSATNSDEQRREPPTNSGRVRGLCSESVEPKQPIQHRDDAKTSEVPAESRTLVAIRDGERSDGD